MAERGYDVVGIGNAIVDVPAHADQAFLASLGGKGAFIGKVRDDRPGAVFTVKDRSTGTA